MVAIKLQWHISNIRCRDDENLWTHFEKLQEMKEKLASLGSLISEIKYAYILLWSLPPSYQSITNAINASANFAKVTIAPTNMTQLVLDEYNCLQGNKFKQDADKAFTTSFQLQRGKQQGK
jgi:gag-polypeptide of LTR copia-type